MRILVVDDIKEVRYMLEVILKSQGYEIVAAENGEVALKRLKEQNFDLIISDILMPVMDGFQLCKITKKEYPHLPFIFYSATYIDIKDKEFALGLGADLFLVKPLPPDELLSEISGLINRIQTDKVETKEPTISDEKDIYKYYSERLVHKLETKLIELEKEIERRIEAEKNLKKIIKEKETLLQELYHRTKNNMQIIISMLKLYSRKITQTEWKAIFKDIENKIRTMSLVQQKLYESNNLSQVNLRSYFESLLDIIESSYLSSNSNIHIKTDIADFEVLLDTAIPLGFVANELITNAIKHAYSGSEGTIYVRLWKDDKNKIILLVEDEGKGLLADVDINSPDNLGMFLITGIVEKQLQGKITHKNENGLKWQITIAQECYTKRV
ncbi:MAG TPA: response regulator [Candidatus Cloacimonadota bacterium]|nr:response regulator [Candidatus Cloacimonadota bacterium]